MSGTLSGDLSKLCCRRHKMATKSIVDCGMQRNNVRRTHRFVLLSLACNTTHNSVLLLYRDNNVYITRTFTFTFTSHVHFLSYDK
jgi:hypothetical protein